MEIQTQTESDVLVAAPHVETLMAGNVEEFRQAMLPLLAHTKKAAIDLSHVQFMDSSGVGAILSCLRLLDSQGGKLALFGMNKAVKGVFQITRMHRIVDGYDTRDEALRAFSPSTNSPPAGA